MSATPTTEDRLAIRQRPRGLPLMHQNWGQLLFMHWQIDAQLLRPLIPRQLSLDTLDGVAWIGVVPFTMWGIRASFLPPTPGTSAFHELNVRTYVHYQGLPGVWFFSLDAASSLAVWSARTFYHLPYFNAQMNLRQDGKTIQYSSRRSDSLTYGEFFAAGREGFGGLDSDQVRSFPRAELRLDWIIDEPLPQSAAGSPEFFFTERYCLYSYHRGKLYRCRIFHEPWPLRAASIAAFQSTMIESLGIPTPAGDPLLHYAESVAVDIWPLKAVSSKQ